MRRSRLIGTTAVAAGTAAALVAAFAPASTAATASKQPPLRLVTATSSVVLDRYDGQVELDLPTHLVAGDSPFEIRVKRPSYSKSLTAGWVTGGHTKPLPAGLVTSFAGLSHFLHVTVTDSAGKVVAQRDQAVCPNGESARTRPDAPDRSPYPDGCSDNPFTVGSVWGIQRGWATSTGSAGSVRLKNGTYTATVFIRQAYRDAFGIPANQASARVRLVVRTPPTSDHDMDAGRAHGSTRPAGTTVAPRPNPVRPTGPVRVPVGPRPDLRPVPAYQIGIDHGDGEGEMAAPARDYLHFAATVWNAGRSPLVLDGFRRHGQSLMDAYQYFYDDNGKQVGYAPTGTLEWDPREGHEHWHFTDFASYRLLDAGKKQIMRSQKEAFCLAATDAIDYTVPNANWHPSNTDLHTACGGAGSLSVREVLDIGSGDTYVQDLPGQSFDVTGLKNGLYYIQVIANPAKRLYEANTADNTALRAVVLGGTRGHRTVKVVPYGVITAP
ncbi:MAG TPA: lysyl oxidase family protein [Kribbellaceae bacterium]